MKYIFFNITILFSLYSFSFGWIKSNNVAVEKIINKPDSYAYTESEQIDLCTVKKMTIHQTLMSNELVTSCKITRQYSHMEKTDLYLINCKDLVDEVSRCSKYFHQSSDQ